MTYKALCSKCLRAVSFNTLPTKKVPCVCGGELCGCDGCMSVLLDLEAGNLSPRGLDKRLGAWSADGGAVGATERNYQLEAYANINRVFGKFGSKNSVLQSAAAKLGAEIHEAILANGGKSVSELMRELFAEGLSAPTEVVALLPPADPKPVTIEDVAKRLGIKNVYVSKRAEPLNPELGHLSLTRRQYESVQIGSDITLTVLQVRADSIAIAFSQGDKRFGSQNLAVDGTAYTMGGAVSVRVADIKGSQVRLHFEAPRSIPIVRTELL